MAERKTFYANIASNKRRTFFVMAGFVAFVGLATWLIGEGLGYGLSLIPAAVVFSSFSAFGSYFVSDKLVLALSGAKPASKDEFFDFYSVVENIAVGTGVLMPKVYVIDSPAPNAFATGRDPKHAVVCATTGLLKKLDRSELEGVVAHEMAHIRDYDILLMSVAAVLVGTVAILADLARRKAFFGFGGNDDDRDGHRGGQLFALLGLLAMIFAPLIAQLLKLALSRQREFLADAEGVKVTRFPEGLARALEKIASDRSVLRTASTGTAHLFIVNPLKGSGFSGKVTSLFSTHPPVEDRIARLRAM